MKIIVAADSFKGSLTTVAAAEQIAAGVHRVFPDAEVITVPMADGGEGTVSAVLSGLGGTLEHAVVTGPLGEKVNAAFGILPGGTAVIEMAEASGLTLVPAEKRDVMRATTFGTGELIRCALDRGSRKILIGIGGSATNDGGAGMAQALGARFYNESGEFISHGGGALSRLAGMDLNGLDARLNNTEITVICDVRNPLCGPQGASFVYGPQKGASPEQAAALDRGLAHFAQIVRGQCGADTANLPGTGAAGGLGWGLTVFAGGTLRSGIEAMLDLSGFNAQAKDADLVITGEGRMDGQSVFGKVPVGVAQRAKQFGLPVFAVVGSVGPGVQAVYRHGVDCIFSAVDTPCTVEEAIAHAEENVQNAAERAMRALQAGMRLAQRE